jgi:ABC-2 type transport system ATP-binding protein
MLETAILEFEGVTRSFGAVRVLDEVTLTVPAGSVVGLVGHNGAGKTTLMKTALGLVRPDAGEVRIDGVPVRQLGSLGGLVGVSLDASTLPPSWTAGTAVRVAADLAGTPAARVAEVLDLVGLGNVPRRRVANFSMGMRQRLALALALLNQPRLLILDEPTNALDPVACHELRGWIRAHAAAGNGVLVSSHNLPEVEQVADRVAVLHKGRLVQDAAKTDLLAGDSALIRVDFPDVLDNRLVQLGRRTEYLPGGVIRVHGATAGEVGAVAAECGLIVRELTSERQQLSDVYQLITAEGPAR